MELLLNKIEEFSKFLLRKEDITIRSIVRRIKLWKKTTEVQECDWCLNIYYIKIKYIELIKKLSYIFEKNSIIIYDRLRLMIFHS